MEDIFTWKWLKAALVRALRTVAQTAAATVGTAAMLSEVDWRMVVSAALLSGALSAAHQRGRPSRSVRNQKITR